MRKVELLAPAGNMQSLIYAVNNGANAVYLGGLYFGARSFANNFNHDELIDAVNYCHLRDVKVYVTVNTLLNEFEFENAIKEITFLYNNNVDGLLIQDLGLLNYVLKCFPDIEVHASTQMHIHNVNGVKLMKKLGLHRVVLARETPIEVIQECVKEGIDIEIFAYGALCTSYSGQCLISSVLANRSGNKGMCAQMCRMKFDLIDDSNKVLNDQKYILSSKDLNTLPNINELLSSGVTSLKIEGRMKRPEYVGYITKIFREAIDAYYENNSFNISEEVATNLKKLFNREFTSGHIFHSKEIINSFRPNHLGVKIGEVIDKTNDKIYIKLSDDLNQQDGLRIISKDDEHGLIANMIYKDDLLVNHAESNDIVAFDFDENVSIGDLVVKTTDIKLNNQINKDSSEFNYRIPIKIRYNAKLDQPLNGEMSDGKNTVVVSSDFICPKATNTPVTKENIEEKLLRINDSVYKCDDIDGIIDEVFIPVKIINELKRNAIEKLNNARLHKETRRILPYNLVLEKPIVNNQNIYISIKNNDQIVTTDDSLLFSLNNIEGTSLITPNINENNKEYKADIGIISELGNILNDIKYKIANYTLNVTNSYALDFLLENRVNEAILSTEIDDLMIDKLKVAFEARNGFKAPIIEYGYGKRCLMYIKDDILSHYTKLSKARLKGYNNELIIYRDDICTKIIENNAFKKSVNESKIFLEFYDEDIDIIKREIKKYGKEEI